jgi:hypothetical protein
MSNVWCERKNLFLFDEEVSYKGYALVNEMDGFKNCWMWGKIDGNDIVDAVLLKGLSSNSYAPWKEVYEKFVENVNQLLT